MGAVIIDKGHGICCVPYRNQDDNAELRALPPQKCQTAKASTEEEEGGGFGHLSQNPDFPPETKIIDDLPEQKLVGGPLGAVEIAHPGNIERGDKPAVGGIEKLAAIKPDQVGKRAIIINGRPTFRVGQLIGCDDEETVARIGNRQTAVDGPLVGNDLRDGTGDRHLEVIIGIGITVDPVHGYIPGPQSGEIGQYALIMGAIGIRRSLSLKIKSSATV